MTLLPGPCDTYLMEQTHTTTTASAAAPWRNRMVPGAAPAPVYANDAPLADVPERPSMSADSAALYALHAPASIARERTYIDLTAAPYHDADATLRWLRKQNIAAHDLLVDADCWKRAGMPLLAQTCRDHAQLLAAAALRDLLDAETRASERQTVGDQGWGIGSGMADPRTLPAGSTSCW